MSCMLASFISSICNTCMMFLVVSAFVCAKTSQNTVVAVRTLRAPKVLQYAIL